MPDTFSRRDFLATSAATGAAVGLSTFPATASAAALASAPSFIHLFLPGGWPCSDLWDPKPHAPFRAGMRGSELTSTVQTIATSAPSIRLGEPLLHISHCIDRGVIIRSLIDESNNTDHRTAQKQMLEALTFEAPVVEMPIDQSVSYGLSQALLAATKLIAAGEKHVRVTLPFEPYQGFDAHESGPEKMSAIVNTIDIVIAAIVGQLESTGQLDRTIFCISSEFSRTIAGTPAPGSDLHTGENLTIFTQREYGFHAHFTQANSIVLFGGPLQRGMAYGKTAPKHPMRVVENPVTLADLHATLAVALRQTPRQGRVIEALLR